MGPLVWGEDADWGVVAGSWNDLETLVTSRFPEVRGVYNALVEAGAGLVRLSGTGATCLAFFEDAMENAEVESRLPSNCRVFRGRTLSRSTVQRLRVVQ